MYTNTLLKNREGILIYLSGIPLQQSQLVLTYILH